MAMSQANDGTREQIVAVTNVSRIYRKGLNVFPALHDINLSLYRGEFVALLGPSGCGKSTLLRLITGLDKPSSGQIHYRGEPMLDVNRKATIVFQSFALYPWLTVRQNVEVALRAHGTDPERVTEVAEDVLDKVGLDGFESAFPRELSGGMRQKVGFARAMAVEPELLCLDEPFSALDVLSAEALRGELKRLWHSHSIPTQAVLMVTHNIEEAVELADRIVVMGKEPGHIVTEFPVTLSHPRHRKDTAFMALVDRVYTAVAGGTVRGGEELPVSVRRQKLPAAHLNALAGLLERLVGALDGLDLYKLASDLAMDLDALLPIVETGEKVGFVLVQKGDIALTPLGRTYAQADVLTRKEIMAGRILRLPIIRWIYETLEQDDDQHVDRGYFLDQLTRDFGDHAGEQLETALSWGRFAELFGYDDKRNEIFLESDDEQAGEHAQR